MVQTPKKHEFGILAVPTEVLADALYLPEGYRIAAIDFDPRSQGILLTLMSYDLPETPAGYALPSVHLFYTVETLPDASPEYRRITSRIEVG